MAQHLILTGGAFGTADDSLQFQGAQISAPIAAQVTSLYVPAITDGQCVRFDVYFYNWTTLQVYVGDASALHPLQISIGGAVTTVTAPGLQTLQFPPGFSPVFFTRENGAIQVVGLNPDTPHPNAAGSTASSPVASGGTTSA